MRKNATKEEFIGKDITVIHSKNSSDVGIKGKVVDETLHTLKIKCKDKIRTIFKKNLIFQAELDGKTFIIEGKKIVKRPEDRVTR